MFIRLTPQKIINGTSLKLDKVNSVKYSRLLNEYKNGSYFNSFVIKLIENETKKSFDFILKSNCIEFKLHSIYRANNVTIVALEIFFSLSSISLKFKFSEPKV